MEWQHTEMCQMQAAGAPLPTILQPVAASSLDLLSEPTLDAASPHPTPSVSLFWPSRMQLPLESCVGIFSTNVLNHSISREKKPHNKTLVFTAGDMWSPSNGCPHRGKACWSFLQQWTTAHSLCNKLLPEGPRHTSAATISSAASVFVLCCLPLLFREENRLGSGCVQMEDNSKLYLCVCSW